MLLRTGIEYSSQHTQLVPSEELPYLLEHKCTALRDKTYETNILAAQETHIFGRAKIIVRGKVGYVMQLLAFLELRGGAD